MCSDPKPATRYLPSGENASATDRPVGAVALEVGQIGHSRQPRQLHYGIDVPERHMRDGCGCADPTARRRLSVGENAMLKARRCSTAGSALTRRPVGGVEEAYAVTTRRDQVVIGRKIAPMRVTPGEGLSSARMAAPGFSRSQTLAVLSALVVRSRLPSRKNGWY